MNVINLLHVEEGFQNPLEGDWFLTTVLKGIDLVKGDQVRRRLPITLDILKAIYKVLNLDQSHDSTFWAACLIAFFGMLRKASLFPTNKVENHMLVGNCKLYSWGIVITSTHCKTIQCQEHEVFVSLPYNSENKLLCPVYALLNSMKKVNCLIDSDHLFKYIAVDGDLVMS